VACGSQDVGIEEGVLILRTPFGMTVIFFEIERGRPASEGGPARTGHFLRGLGGRGKCRWDKMGLEDLGYGYFVGEGYE